MVLLNIGNWIGDNSVSLSVTISFAGVVVTSIMVILTYFSLKQNKKQMRELEKQRIESERAKLVFKIIRIDSHNAFYLSITNIGKTTAIINNLKLGGDLINENPIPLIKRNNTYINNQKICIVGGDNLKIYLSPIYIDKFIQYNVAVKSNAIIIGGIPSVLKKIEDLKNWHNTIYDLSLIIKCSYQAYQNESYTVCENYTISQFMLGLHFDENDILSEIEDRFQITNNTRDLFSELSAISSGIRDLKK